MSEPNATPTRADVLREYVKALTDENVRLRAERAAMIRRVEALQRYVPVEALGRGEMEPCDWGAYIEHDAVLAALRDGGTDGR